VGGGEHWGNNQGIDREDTPLLGANTPVPVPVPVLVPGP
jgi:hypothetical protein